MGKLSIDQAETFLQNEANSLMQQLTDKHKAQWGIMTPQHMVEHLVWSLRNSIGEISYKLHTPEEHLPKFLAFLDTNIAIMPLFKAPVLSKTETEPLVYESLEVAKGKFASYLQSFFDYYQKNPEATTLNPVYGEMDREAWIKLHFKHFLHHLHQFGIADVRDYDLKPFEKR